MDRAFGTGAYATYGAGNPIGTQKANGEKTVNRRRFT